MSHTSMHLQKLADLLNVPQSTSTGALRSGLEIAVSIRTEPVGSVRGELATVPQYRLVDIVLALAVAVDVDVTERDLLAWLTDPAKRRTCAYCGESFVPNHTSATCSAVCLKGHRRIRSALNRSRRKGDARRMADQAREAAR